MEDKYDFKMLEKRIANAQKKFGKKNPDSPLLKLVNIEDTGIHWTAEFGARYAGKTAYEGLCKYVKDLDQARGK